MIIVDDHFWRAKIIDNLLQLVWPSFTVFLCFQASVIICVRSTLARQKAELDSSVIGSVAVSKERVIEGFVVYVAVIQAVESSVVDQSLDRACMPSVSLVEFLQIIFCTLVSVDFLHVLIRVTSVTLDDQRFEGDQALVVLDLFGE